MSRSALFAFGNYFFGWGRVCLCQLEIHTLCFLSSIFEEFMKRFGSTVNYAARTLVLLLVVFSSSLTLLAQTVNVTTLTSGGITQYPNGLAIDLSGSIYVQSGTTASILKITLDGNRTSIGQNIFSKITGIAVDAAGNLFLSTWYQQCIYKISPNGLTTVFASVYLHLPELF